MKKSILALLACLMIFVMALAGCGTDSTKSAAPAQKEELLVYAGAGLKKPMEQIKAAFEKSHPNVTIQYVYAGSGQLLAQLKESGKGDVFIVGSKKTYDLAKEAGLTVGEGESVAHHTPCIVVAKGNPKHIEGLADLEKPGIRVGIGEAKANAIGMTSQKIFAKNHLEGIMKNVVVQTATVNELYTALSQGNVDAVIATKDGAFSHKDNVTIIDIPNDQNIDQIITATVLKASKHEKLANEFLQCLVNEASQKDWAEYGFKPVK